MSTSTQNKFEAAFTADERIAIANLKKQIPEIVKNAAASESDFTSFTLWGVTLDPQANDPRADVILVKFLRARNLDPVAAGTMLTGCLAWRRTFRTDSILDEEFPDQVFANVGKIQGKDIEGRPIIYNLYGDIDQEVVYGDLNRFIRWRVKLMEKSVRLVDFETVDSMIQVHDYKGASLFGRTSNVKAAAKDVIQIMSDNYPEFLTKKFFVNIPWWGSKIFALIRPLLPENTVAKFIVCSTTEARSEMLKVIPEDQLPIRYGGLLEDVTAVEKKVNLEEPVEEDSLGVD